MFDKALKGTVMHRSEQRETRYWASRPDRNNLDLFWAELQQGRLRQGWGYHESLSHEVILSKKKNLGEENWWASLSDDQHDAYWNYPFHPGWGEDTMHQGDIVLVPNLPYFGRFALVRMLDDEYHFAPIDLQPEQGQLESVRDYGHWRRVTLLTTEGIPNDHSDVDAPVRTTLRCRSRIWRIDHLKPSVDRLLKKIGEGQWQPDDRAGPERRYITMMEVARNSAITPARRIASDEIDKLIDHHFQGGEFETPVRLLLERLFPNGIVEHTSGTAESKHGTDLLVRMNNPLGDEQFLVPVQVKKHEGETNDGVDQLVLALDYWKREGTVVALALITTAEKISVEAEKRVAELESKCGVRCYVIARRKLLSLLVDVALMDARQSGRLFSDDTVA